MGIQYGRSKSLKGYDCAGVSKFLKSNDPFINRAEANILTFRYLMMENNNNLVLNYLKIAMSQWVITSEVRTRLYHCARVIRLRYRNTRVWCLSVR